MKKISGIIFDIDGTIAQTNQLIFETIRFVTNKYLNINYTDAEIIAMFGPTEEDILSRMLNGNYKAGISDYYNFYEKNHSSFVKPYKGMSELLKLLHEKNIPLSIYTGKGKVSAKITLEKLDLLKYFSLVITGGDIKGQKPSGEGVDIFVEKFDLKRDEVILIGDATADIYAARNAGIKGASVLWDSYGKDEVLKLGNNFMFYTVNELTNFFNTYL